MSIQTKRAQSWQERPRLSWPVSGPSAGRCCGHGRERWGQGTGLEGRENARIGAESFHTRGLRVGISGSSVLINHLQWVSLRLLAKKKIGLEK